VQVTLFATCAIVTVANPNVAIAVRSIDLIFILFNYFPFFILLAGLQFCIVTNVQRFYLRRFSCKFAISSFSLANKSLYINKLAISEKKTICQH
jgi:hypothetical protein